MAVELYDYQKLALEKLKNGCILVGGVGSGKSRTSLAYYFVKECEGTIDEYSPMKKPKDLYIITTARKRDQDEWQQELIHFLLSTNKDLCHAPVIIVVDSWNNIAKYTNIKNSFFIFDEQRVVGHGKWTKSFLKICEENKWILLSATPGDTWIDYIPVFIANGFYKNRTEFLRRHVVYNNFTRYPKIDHYIEVARLVKLRNQILIHMHFHRKTISHDKIILTEFDRELFHKVMIGRWHIYEDRPIKDVSELCYTMRKVVNSDSHRIIAVKELIEKHPKVIIFYNFNYELDLLLALGKELQIPTTQWNGHKHELIPKSDTWIYLVQYAAGAEAWNCIETDTIIFYSQNYSYKTMIQAAGRIDRVNTPFIDLYYYHLRSTSSIDMSIQKALKNKQNFNESHFINISPSREKHLL